MYYFVHHFLVHYKYLDKDPTLNKIGATLKINYVLVLLMCTLAQKASSQSRPSSGNPSLSESNPQTRPSPT